MVREIYENGMFPVSHSIYDPRDHSTINKLGIKEKNQIHVGWFHSTFEQEHFILLQFKGTTNSRTYLCKHF